MTSLALDCRRQQANQQLGAKNVNKSILSFAAAALATLAAGSASAYATFSGVDTNGAEAALAVTPNSSAAETAFKANLIGVGTENFESQATGATTPLTLNFGSAGNATLQGGSGFVNSVAAGTTNGVGRYSVPGGTQYFETVAGGSAAFSINFDQEVAAFGFYGIDIGDINGTVKIEFLNGNAQVIGSLAVPQAAANLANGSVLYFGAIAQNNSELFRSVRFITTGSSDFFGFDSFTVGAQGQISRVPEPASLMLIGVAMLGLGLSRRRS
jgi:PEP-CTERM motif